MVDKILGSRGMDKEGCRTCQSHGRVVCSKLDAVPWKWSRRAHLTIGIHVAKAGSSSELELMYSVLQSILQDVPKKHCTHEQI